MSLGWRLLKMADVMRVKAHIKNPFSLSELYDIDTGKHIPFSEIEFSANVGGYGELKAIVKMIVHEIEIDEIEVYKTGVEKY